MDSGDDARTRLYRCPRCQRYGKCRSALQGGELDKRSRCCEFNSCDDLCKPNLILRLGQLWLANRLCMSCLACIRNVDESMGCCPESYYAIQLSSQCRSGSTDRVEMGQRFDFSSRRCCEPFLSVFVFQMR